MEKLLNNSINMHLINISLFLYENTRFSFLNASQLGFRLNQDRSCEVYAIYITKLLITCKNIKRALNFGDS